MLPLVLMLILVAALLVMPGKNTKPRGGAMSTWAKLPFYVLGGLVVALLFRIGLPWLAAGGALLGAAWRLVGPAIVRLLPVLLASLATRARQAQAKTSTSEQPHTQMTRDEALSVLGLTEGASDTEIQAAYTDLIRKVHPDRGGTAYLAARVNLARDLLVRMRSGN